MRWTGRVGYGVRALFDMAYHGEGRAVQAREVAERQEIPLRYLEQILQELRRAGLVEGKRGPGGGYALARPAAALRLSEVIAALDGPLEGAPVEETAPEAESGGHVPALVLRELAARIEGLLAGVTIQDLVVRAEALGVARADAAAQMYFI